MSIKNSCSSNCTAFCTVCVSNSLYSQESLCALNEKYTALLWHITAPFLLFLSINLWLVEPDGETFYSLPQTGTLLLSSLATIEHMVMVTGMASK